MVGIDVMERFLPASALRPCCYAKKPLKTLKKQLFLDNCWSLAD
jgi:hypothetical protein